MIGKKSKITRLPERGRGDFDEAGDQTDEEEGDDYGYASACFSTIYVGLHTP